ncbi:MAG: hypothetical protein FD138_3336 [Planctomycetota bacterium]|nr:MAG: hypothetical protein FD138_3336 [Planctomycetota bacterium]
MSEAVSPAVCFQRLSFRYPSGPDVLTDISFTIAPGEIVGLQRARPVAAGSSFERAR